MQTFSCPDITRKRRFKLSDIERNVYRLFRAKTLQYRPFITKMATLFPGARFRASSKKTGCSRAFPSARLQVLRICFTL
jgi:hypothetical protein